MATVGQNVMKLAAEALTQMAVEGKLQTTGVVTEQRKFVNGVATDELKGYRYEVIAPLVGVITISVPTGVAERRPRKFDYLQKVVPRNLVGGILDNGNVWFRADALTGLVEKGGVQDEANV